MEDSKIHKNFKVIVFNKGKISRANKTSRLKSQEDKTKCVPETAYHDVEIFTVTTIIEAIDTFLKLVL